ncbi:hypothetical protein NDS46_04660 [Paenibacillus thiaminolyticus]|nr:hypothetical protein [Paenibacillus thiaminolyticus]WCF09202.1 hypothetical protein NDS46_04660 [Paenibacillus thiaminolyticus]
MNEEGQLELISGELCSFEEAKRNGFDARSISVVNTSGLETEVAQEELA